MAEQPNQGGNPPRNEGGGKLVREVSLDVSLAEEGLRDFSEKLRAFEVALSKHSDALIRSTIIIDRLNADISKLHALILYSARARQASARAIEMARKTTEEYSRKMEAHARATSRSTNEIERFLGSFRGFGTAARELEEATKAYALNIVSLALLPYAAFKGLYESINETIRIAREFKDSISSLDRSIISSVTTLNRWAERGGVRGWVARRVRAIPIAYSRLTRGFPRRVARAVRGVRAPRLTDFLMSVGWARQLEEATEEQRGIRRLLSTISGGIGVITGFFSRLLRYVWEILIIQKLGIIAKGISDSLRSFLAGVGGASIASSIAGALSGIASSITSALSAIATSLAGVAGGAVAGITIAGKIGEVLGVSSEAIARASMRLREKAEEAEKHGNTIASAFYNASVAILGFSKQIWEAGDQAKQWLSTHIPLIGGALGEIAQGFLHGVSLLFSANAMASNFLGNLSTQLGGLAGWLRNIISSFITNAGNALNGFANWVGSQLQNAWNTVKSNIEGFGNWAKTQLEDAWKGFTNTLKTSLDTLINTLSGIWNKITGFFSGIADKLGLGGIGQTLSNASNAVSGAFKSVVDAVSGFGKALTGHNPGVITHLEELGASLREASSLVSGLSIQPAGGDQYSLKIVDLLSELIEEVRMLREEASKSKPEVNVSIKTSESLYLRRR